MHTHIVWSWNLLRYSYGTIILLAGIDKVLGTNLIVNWAMYISPFAANLLPISAGTFLALIGLIEVVVAIMLLTKFQKLGAYLSVAWLLLISINLLLLGYIDIAIRDVLLAVGALVLAQLTEVIQSDTAQSVA